MLDNETARFLGDPAGWVGARLELADIHGLWGGCDVVLAGDGHCRVTRVRLPGSRDGTFERPLGSEVARELFDLCVANDLVTIRFPPRYTIVPDEARPQINLINAAGDRQEIARWANDPPDPGFAAIYAALRSLAQTIDSDPTPPQ
jgi:hypothetical protein